MEPLIRTKNELIAFAQEHGYKVAAFDIENKSGATLVRTKLIQLIAIIAKKEKQYSNTQILKYSKEYLLLSESQYKLLRKYQKSFFKLG